MNKLREKRNALMDKADALVKKAETEVRSFTDAEKAEYDNTVREIRSLDAQLATMKEHTKLEAGKNQNQPDGGTQEEQETRAFRDYLMGKLSGDKSIETRANITHGANGAVIPTTIMNKIIDKVVNISPLYAAATKYSVKGNITIPYVDTTSGDVTVAFASEFSSLTASAIKFSSITLQGYLAAALVLISKQLINNSQFDIVSYVINYMAKKIAVFLEDKLIKGDTTNMDSDSGLANSVTQHVDIAAVNQLTGDKLIDVQDTIPDVYQAGAFWLMSPKTRTAIRKIKDGQNNYLLIKDFNSPTGYTLLGKPVYITDNLPGVAEATEDEAFLYYGDFSGLAVKIGEGAEIQVLNEVYATQHALGLVAWFEFDCTVEDKQKITKLVLNASS